jgi:hypothetical protein
MSNDPETGPQCALFVMCGECGQGAEVPLPIDREGLARFLAQSAWFMSILTPPGQVPILFGALCGECATRVFPPEVLRTAEERRQRMLQGLS